jgi:2'-5' RNA ligase
MNFVRAFIAIEIPKPVQDAVERQTARLRQTLGNDLIRWIPAHNIHITLKFLGDVSEAHINFLKQMIARESDSHPQFEMQIGGLGAYPNLRKPRVLWIGLHAPDVLASLQKNIEAGAVRFGYEREERAFTPHLTIGRVRQSAPTTDLLKIRAALDSTQFGNFERAKIDALHLFKSDLTPGGSIYTKLFSAPLKADSKIS